MVRALRALKSPHGRQPLSLGAIWRADDQELSERRAEPSLNIASKSVLAMANRSGTSRRDRQVTGRCGVVLMW
jgi:hypothetical protein